MTNGEGDWRLEMRRLYASGLTAKLESLHALVEALDRDPSAAGRQDLLEAVHKIRGSAGAYGFDELSRIAAEWEMGLEAGAGIELLRGFSARIDAAARAALDREV